jgi:hypothetical protein
MSARGRQDAADEPDGAADASDGSTEPRRARRRRREAVDRAPVRRARSADRPVAVRPAHADEVVDWRHPQRWLAVSSTVLLIGLGLVGLGPSPLGTALSVLGAVALLYAIHKYGRLGPEHGR